MAMKKYDQELKRQKVISEELLSDETIEWTGQPDQWVIFDNADIFFIPISLLWGGFWMLVVMSALFGNGQGDSDPIGALFCLFFLLVGQYMIWGRFVCKVWKKKYTYYAVTNKRVLVVLRWMLWRTLQAAFIKDIPAISKSVKRNGIGTLVFGNSDAEIGHWANFRIYWARQRSEFTPPAFYDIREVNTLYVLVNRVRNEPEAQ